ncbi:MAG: hypothetical protein A2X36_16720 [Elusimicrobia bacterium GWA2_69_24]|nr:MAG: hypothetical protein A2X36_16720 [Elusimicrobia bacterium GWA2_69_24]HBL16640.1 CRTAC1 family protein [Elusimicrobiota bacterium]
MEQAPRKRTALAVLLVCLGLAALAVWESARRLRPAPPPRGPILEWDRPPLPFRLTDVSRAAGITHAHRKFRAHPSLANIAPWLVAYEAAVAVADVDGDGWQDIYLTSGEPGSRNALYRNNHDGTFTDIAGRAGLADVNQKTGSARPLFFDYDNDGKKDLLLTTYHCAKVFHNEGNARFRDVTAASGLRHCGFAPASNVLDYDGDGFLDVIIGDYFKPVDLLRPADYRFMHHSYRVSANGGTAAVYRNNANGTFTRVPGDLGMRKPMWNLAIGVYDLRGTGRPDLHFALDYGLDALYLNEGGGRFADASAELSDTDSMSSMSSEFGDPFNEGRPMLFVSEIYSRPFVPEGNILWRRRPDGRFEDVADRLGVKDCGWAWGPKFVDLDNDSLQDLVVTNGYVSANRGKDYWDLLSVFVREEGRDMEDSRVWPAMADASMDGYQQKCVFWNRGDRFENVVAGTGMKLDFSDGRGLAVIDYLNDGGSSLIASSVGQPARLYRDEPARGNGWIGFRLRGTRSSRDAFGAEVTIRLRGGRTLGRQLQPANGFQSQSDDRLHFGLGPAPAIESVTVRWPSGARQELGTPAPGRYHDVVEPRGP